MDRKERPVNVFVHGEGREPVVLDADPTQTVAEVLGRAQVAVEGLHVFVGESAPSSSEEREGDADDQEDSFEPVQVQRVIGGFTESGHVHIHVHRCRRVAVTVNYQSSSKKHRFAPATRIETVLAWAKKKFRLTDADADKLLLQICGTHRRPRPTQHLGEVVTVGSCAICFDLVFDEKVEG